MSCRANVSRFCTALQQGGLLEAIFKCKEGREHACCPACAAVARHQAFARLSLVTATCRGILGRGTRGEHDADIGICTVSSSYWSYRSGARAEVCALSLLPAASGWGMEPLLWGSK